MEKLLERPKLLLIGIITALLILIIADGLTRKIDNRLIKKDSHLDKAVTDGSKLALKNTTIIE